jgi:hypothetical protein
MRRIREAYKILLVKVEENGDYLVDIGSEGRLISKCVLRKQHENVN